MIQLVTKNTNTLYMKNKEHNTKMQMQKKQTVLYWIVYLWNWVRIL